MKNLFRQNVVQSKPYVPGKPIQELGRELGIKDIVKLASNENPLGPSPVAINAIKNELDSLNLYPDGNCFYLKNKLAEKIQLQPENFIIGNGSNDIIELAFKTFICCNDNVVISDKSFIVYKMCAQLMDIEPKIIPMKNFTHDLEAMADAVCDKTKIIALCNPNNPTGTIFTPEEFDKFMESIPKDVVVIIDEAYHEYLDKEKRPDVLKYLREGRNIIILRTFSKIYGLSGLRVGYGITTPEIANNMNKIRQPFNVNSLAQVAALSALDDNVYVEASLKSNKQGMEYLTSELDKAGIEYVPSHANFLLINVGQSGMDCYNKLLKQGVIVRPMDGYGLGNYIRVTVGLPEQNERFIRVVKSLKSCEKL